MKHSDSSLEPMKSPAFFKDQIQANHLEIGAVNLL